MVINLLVNSFKFTSKGSIKIIVDYLEDEDLISISIQDTGCGMTNEEIENILEVM